MSRCRFRHREEVRKTSPIPPVPAPLDPNLAEFLTPPPLQQYDVSMSLPTQGGGAKDLTNPAVAAPRDAFSFKTATLFFGSSSLGAPIDGMERWQPGEEPVIVTSAPDPDMKAIASSPATSDQMAKTGESIASKGEVNIDNQRVKTPAERLGLFDQKSRARHEKCLAEAVYFEARGEAVRGQ